MKKQTRIGMIISLIATAGTYSMAQDKPKGWEVNDMDRPIPAKVDPGMPSTQEQAGKAPSDAVVLFDGKDLSQWASEDGSEAKWNVGDGFMQVVKGTGNIHSKKNFHDCQVHVEWLSPESDAKGQARNNSGVFLMGLYEIQVLDTYDNRTYADGMAGAIYGQFPPLVNPAMSAGHWQTYDIIFHRPHSDADGKVIQPATFTILFNGVLVQDGTASIGPTTHHVLVSYPANHPDEGPLTLQNHGGDPVKYRNVWVRELSDAKPEAPVRSHQ